jgi:hypothetical protein
MSQRRSQRYPFRVEGKDYHIQFLPMTYLDGYDDEDLARLGAADAWEVTFMLEDFVLPDGTVVGGYGTIGTGHPFQILGGVANGILDWAEKNRPTYLYWYAEARRQQLYERMISYLAARGSPWRRSEVDPITGMLCAPEAFWMACSLPPSPVPHERP